MTHTYYIPDEELYKSDHYSKLHDTLVRDLLMREYIIGDLTKMCHNHEKTIEYLKRRLNEDDKSNASI